MPDPMPIDKPKPRFRILPRAQNYLLLLILLGYPVISILLNRFNSIEPGNITSRIEQVYLPALVIQLFMLLLVLAVIRGSGGSYGDIGLAKSDVSWSNALSGFIFFFGAWALIIIIKGAVERSGYLAEREFMYLLPVTITERIVWFFLSVGAALSEEITFRGYAVSRLKVVTGGYFIAAFLSSTAFSLGHLYQGPAGVFLTFVYGMLFAGLFVARRSVFPCIIAHFMQDVLILFVFTGQTPK